MRMEPNGLVAALHEVVVVCQPVSSPGLSVITARRLICVPFKGNYPKGKDSGAGFVQDTRTNLNRD